MSRRPPPPFLTAELSGREWVTPRLARLVLQGQQLRSLQVPQPASSVRVLLPHPDRPDQLEIPGWDGDRFVTADRQRPPIRTLTPRHFDPERGTLAVDVVVHGDGAASRWASEAPPGAPAAVSGPARGYTLEPNATALILAGDETAIAAVSQLVESAPAVTEVSVYLETATAARPPLPEHPRCRVEWLSPDGAGPGQALAERLGRVDVPEGARLWAAGEAAAMQRLRHNLLRERGVPRAQVTIRGYWKHGRVSAPSADGA